jgi:fatty acid desaturase
MAIEPSGTEPTPPPPPPSGSSPAQGMPDIPRGTLVGLIASVLLLISVFFTWYSVEVKIAGLSTSKGASGWDATDVAKLVFLLALIAAAALALEQFGAGVELPVPASMISGVCGILALLLVLYRLISKPDFGIKSFSLPDLNGGQKLFDVNVGTSWGIYVSLIAAAAMIVGAYLAMSDSTT